MTIWPEGYDRRILAQVDSTMSEAQRMGAELSAPTWILALVQTAARGRRGRAWVNPKGNLSASLAMRLGDTPDQMALRSFVASLALRDALESFIGDRASLSLKWPNDVLLNGGKVAGILLESVGGLLIVGIGVNLIASPPVEAVEAGAVRPVSVAGETGIEAGPEAFLEALAGAFAKWEAQFRIHGFAPIRRAWLSHAARLGEEITAKTMRDTYFGRLETVDDAGNLVLASAEGRVVLPAADVYF